MKQEYSKRDARFRLDRIRSGGEFGCGETHIGWGGPNCPVEPHHHHDMFCEMPTKEELESVQNPGG